MDPLVAFNLLAILHNAALNMGVQISVQDTSLPFFYVLLTVWTQGLRCGVWCGNSEISPLFLTWFGL